VAEKSSSYNRFHGRWSGCRILDRGGHR
jgi:hypothetical protein